MDERHLTSEGTPLLSIQRAYFETGVTLPCSARRTALRNLETAILRHKEALLSALQQDLGKLKPRVILVKLGFYCAKFVIYGSALVVGCVLSVDVLPYQTFQVVSGSSGIRTA